MFLEIDGLSYQGFTNQTIRRSIDQVSGSFLFTATNEELEDFPVKQFSDCRVIIPNVGTLGSLDVPVLTGYIDIIEIIYSANSHQINIQGRDKTSALIDSSVWDRMSFKGPVNFVTIANAVIADIGADIEIINNFGIIDDFKKTVDAEVGESAFSFLERLARQRQILLTSDGDGNLVLTRGGGVKIFTLLLHQRSNKDNNVLNAQITFDNSKRFSQYKVLGQTAEDELGFTLPGNQTVAEGNSTDSDALAEKKLIIVAEEGIDLDTAQKRAEWESNIRRAQSVVYNCQVQGNEHLQGLWEVNQLVRVVDDFADIDSDMLIRSVEYIVSGDGTFTNMELVSPDAYTLEVDVPIFTKKTNKFFWE